MRVSYCLDQLKASQLTPDKIFAAQTALASIKWLEEEGAINDETAKELMLFVVNHFNS